MLKLSYSEKIKPSPLTALFKNYYICLISRCITYGLPAIIISKDSGALAVHADTWVIQGLVCPGCYLLRSLLASDPSLPHTMCRLFSNLFSQNCTFKEV